MLAVGVVTAVAVVVINSRREEEARVVTVVVQVRVEVVEVVERGSSNNQQI